MTTKQLLTQLKKVILKECGPKCMDFHWACAVCDVWLALAILEDLLETDIKPVKGLSNEKHSTGDVNNECNHDKMKALVDYQKRDTRQNYFNPKPTGNKPVPGRTNPLSPDYPHY